MVAVIYFTYEHVHLTKVSHASLFFNTSLVEEKSKVTGAMEKWKRIVGVDERGKSGTEQ